MQHPINWKAKKGEKLTLLDIMGKIRFDVDPSSNISELLTTPWYILKEHDQFVLYFGSDDEQIIAFSESHEALKQFLQTL